MAEVILKKVSKIYDDGTKAVSDVNIEIKDKEFIVLVGPSGCGKTTTLRMIAGLEEISEGEIFIDGKSVNNLKPKDRDIAMVFQNYALYPHMSVYDNLAFGLKLRKFSKEEIKKRVDHAAEILGLETYLTKKPKALSGGQRQRVAVGRAIIRNPKVFLFDEPLSNLDAKLRVQMRAEISRLHKNLNATIIYVTHDQVEAMTMGDKIVIMKDGIVQQYDSPMQLYNNPVNKFVAGFIGSPAMNFIEGKIFSDTNQYYFKSLDEKLKFLLPAGFSLKEKITELDVELGIRPEHIKLCEFDSSENPFKIESSIDLIEPLGSRTLVYFSFQGSTVVSESQSLLPNIDRRRDYTFVLDETKIYFFDKAASKLLG